MGTQESLSLPHRFEPAQLIGHDLPGFTAIGSDQTLEEAFSSGTISLCLEINVNYFSVLIDRPPQVVLLSIDLYEHFINVEGIAITTVLSLQSPGVLSPELDTP
jgi:hypothetical protein